MRTPATRTGILLTLGLFGFEAAATTSYPGIGSTLTATSEPGSPGSSLYLGETATFRIEIAVSETDQPVELALLPPLGLAVIGATVDTTGFAGTVEHLTHTGPDSSGTSVNWDLGSVHNPVNGDFGDDVFVVEVTARATGEAGFASELPLFGSTVITGVATDSTDTPVDFLLPEPVFSVSLFNQTEPLNEPEVGDRMLFAGALTSFGQGPVCAPTVQLEAPEGFAVLPPGSDELDNDGDGQTDEADEQLWTHTESTVSATLSGCMAFGETGTWALYADATPSLETTPTAFRASVTSFQTLASGGETVIPTDAPAEAPVDPAVPTLQATLVPSTATPTPGQSVDWTLTLRNDGPEVFTDPLSAALDIPAPLLLDTSSVSSTAMFTVTSDRIELTLPDLQASQTVTLTFTTSLPDPLPDGETVTLQGTLLANGRSWLTDDPATAADDDSTTLTVDSSDDLDGDGLDAATEALLGTSDTDTDSDDDGLPDAVEVAGTGVLAAHGPTDPADADSDDDGLPDGLEVGLVSAGPDTVGFLADADPTTLTDPNVADTDGDGLDDGEEDADHDGAVSGRVLGGTGTTGAGETDPLNADSDADGLSDGDEVELYGTDPNDTDTDDGGVPDHQEIVDETDPNDAMDENGDPDGDGLNTGSERLLGTDPQLADTDGDGLDDGDEVHLQSNPLHPDSDHDGLRDGAEATLGTSPNQADSDGDGLDDGDELTIWGSDPLLADTDSDGLNDAVEADLGSAPARADTDGDGLLDEAEHLAGTSLTARDTDADGLWDGDETDLWTTDPLQRDTDQGGLPDGAEVAEGRDPLDATDDGSDQDSDEDGLSDLDELAFGSNPWQADSDGDGIPDAVELAGGTDPRTPDTDGDGLSDAFEEGRSDPTLRDTDGDGLSDGEEITVHGTAPTTADSDADGLSDAQELLLHQTDPNAADSDGDGVEDAAELAAGTDPRAATLADSDGDGLSDADELLLGTDPTLADSDGDGLRDGEEALVFDTDPTLADTDGDGLSDGLEAASVRTDPRLLDTDGGGTADGAELEAGDDPLSAFDDDPAADVDGDGLTVREELAAGTNPGFPDTDGDGLTDGQEVNTYGTDPLVADTDGGGASDGVEVAQGTDPFLAGDDDPDLDSDGDGLTDLEEADAGTDPYSADSDDDGLSDADELLVHRTDPLDSDTDGGSVGDAEEVAFGTDPLDAADDRPGRYAGGTATSCATSPVGPATGSLFVLLSLAGLRRRARN